MTFLAPNSGTRERIKGQIDIELIEQQMNSGTIDYAQLFGGLISLLGQLCSPARDGLVEKAKKETDCVSQMAHITNLLRLMRVDMTNYAIRQIRPTIQARSDKHVPIVKYLNFRSNMFSCSAKNSNNGHKAVETMLHD